MKKCINLSLVYKGVLFLFIIFTFLNPSLQVFPEKNFTYEKFLEYMGNRFAKLQDSREFIDNLPEDFGFKKSIEFSLKGDFLKEKIMEGFSIKELWDKGDLKNVLFKGQDSGKLDLSNFKINNLLGLNELLEKITFPVLELDLSNNNLIFIPKFTSKKLLFLKILNLSYNYIGFLEKGAFDILLRLKHLDLSQNEITFLDINLFSNFKKLKTLDLSDNNLKEIDPDLFKNLIKIERINLADNKIEKLDKEIFSGLKNLKEVFFKGNKINESFTFKPE